MGLEAVDPSPGREEQQVGVCRGVDQVRHRVLVLELGACDALPAATLGPEGRSRHGLHVARGAHGEDQFFVVNEVLDVQLTWVVDDLTASGRGMVGPDGNQFVLDDGQQTALVGQNGLQLGDGLTELGHPFLEVGTTQPGQANQLHIQDVVGLYLGELERVGHQTSPGRLAVGRATDQGDYVVNPLQGLEQAFRGVCLVPCSTQPELAPPSHHLHLVVHIGHQQLA